MKKNIIAFGEIVWDRFEDSSVLGGAPLNVAYHIHQQKWPVLLISRIGCDELGKQTCEQIKKLGLDTLGIQKDPNLPTGSVLVTKDENNEPHFEIAEPAAWDNINAEEIPSIIKTNNFHLIFGTLSQRDQISRNSLKSLWKIADKIFYDVNLRPPFTPIGNVIESLKVSDIVKVNLDELSILGEHLGQKGTAKEDIGANIMQEFDLSLLVVTEGGKGAWLVHKNKIYRHPGFSVSVVDTVGSGDAFFSGIITGYLEGLPFEQTLEKANKLGAYVASKRGATPSYE